METLYGIGFSSARVLTSPSADRLKTPSPSVNRKIKSMKTKLKVIRQSTIQHVTFAKRFLEYK